MLLTPGLDNPGCVLERGAHRSGPFPIWVEPDWKFHILVHHSAGAIIRFLHSLFDAQRLIGQFTDRYQRAPAQFTAERWFTALFAVAQHTDMKVVVNRVRFGATDAQIMNKLVEYRRQLLGLPSASLSAAKRVFHRLRLVDQKQETTRVLTTDFGLVCHGFSPLLVIGESIRLRTLKGTPERAIRCLNVPRTAYKRSHVNFAPPAHPSAGAIGASLVVNCRAINSRNVASVLHCLKTQKNGSSTAIEEPAYFEPRACAEPHPCRPQFWHRRRQQSIWNGYELSAARYEKGIGESIRPRTLKGLPARRNPRAGIMAPRREPRRRQPAIAA